jgi:GntR family transcriptional regulator
MPKYQYIAEEILKRITSGMYAETRLIPDELTLCKEFDCSRMTVKKALELLVARGIIFRKRGHGTFIMQQSLHKDRLNIANRELNGFTKVAPGTVSSRIIEFKIDFAAADVARNLNIKVNDHVYFILRARYINEEPYTIEKTYMPAALIPGLTRETLTGSIYNYIENELGLTITSSSKKIRADKPTELDRQYLNLQPDEPVLEIEQIAYLKNGIAFEYSFARHRYDKFEFNSFGLHNKRLSIN